MTKFTAKNFLRLHVALAALILLYDLYADWHLALELFTGLCLGHGIQVWYQESRSND